MPKVGYLVAHFPILSETFVGEEIRAIQKREQLQLVVMSLSSKPAQPGDLELAAHAIMLKSQGALAAIRGIALIKPTAVDALLFVIRQRRLPKLSLLWNSWKLASAFQATDCRHIHAHFAGGAAAHAIVAAKWSGITCSFVCHGHDFYVEPQDVRLKLACANHAIAVCDDLAADLASVSGRSDIKCIPCGVDPQKFQPLERHRKNGKLLFIGRLVPEKGVADLIEALKHTVWTGRIEVVGDGPLLTHLKTQVQHADLSRRIHFLGIKDRDWIRLHGPEYEGLIAPFRRGPDGSQDTGPLVVKEAMAMGLPVITSYFMGMKQTVTEDTGIFSIPGNALSLAAALDRFSALPPFERRAMGARARARVLEQFTTDIQAARLQAIFND